MKAVYRLKPMVAARLLAEVSALGLLVLLPLFLLIHGDFGRISVLLRALAMAAAMVSLVVLPAYGFVTYKVEADDEGLKTFSFFKRQFARWENISTLKLRTNWGWRRFVIQCEDETELNFPVWLNNVHELTELIRARVPNRGSSIAGATTKVFAQDASATVIQFIKASAMLIFIVLCWIFLADMMVRESQTTDFNDRLFMLGACILFTIFLLVRSGFLLMMPRKIAVDDDGLQLTGHFYYKQLSWEQVHAVRPPLFILPDGLFVRSDEGIYLIGDQLDGFDELQDELLKHLPPRTVAQS